MKKEITCIRCPIGCQLLAEIDGDRIEVTGNNCPRGAEYGKKEVTNPTRTVTGSVRIANGELPLVSVKTASDIPKDKVLDVMEAIHQCHASAPVSIGDILISDAAGTGVDVIATRDVPASVSM